MASMAMASNNNSNPNPNTSSDFPKTLLQVNLLDASLDGTLYESCDSCEYETVSFELTAANLDRIYEFLQEDPTFKLSPIANPPVLTPPVITPPLDADPLMRPYDPKTNFLSPRPQFLHYKPKPAVEIDSYLRELEEASLDSEEDTQSEGSKKESEDASLEQVVSLQEQKRPKPQFSLRSKAAVALILLLSVSSVCCFCGTYKSSEFGAKMEDQPATLIVSEHEAAKSEENQTHGDDALESNLEAAENMYDDDEHQLFDHFFPASSKDDVSSLSPLMDPLFKCEEMKIQAWENHQIRKAEMEMKKMEVPYNLALGASESEIEHLYLLLLLFAGAIVVVGATFSCWCRSKKEVVSEAKINQKKRKYRTGLEKIDYGPSYGSQTVYELLPKQKELVPVRRSNRIRGQQS